MKRSDLLLEVHSLHNGRGLPPECTNSICTKARAMDLDQIMDFIPILKRYGDQVWARPEATDVEISSTDDEIPAAKSGNFRKIGKIPRPPEAISALVPLNTLEIPEDYFRFVCEVLYKTNLLGITCGDKGILLNVDKATLMER